VDQRTRILREVESLLEPAETEVVDVETAGSSRGLLVRVLVDRPGGITLDDCARLSRALGDEFEAKDLIAGRYVLEVSSPGVDRPLRRSEDYQKFSGESAEIVTYEKIDGRHKHLGTLSGLDSRKEAVLLEVEGGEPLAIPLGTIRKANLRRDPWPESVRRARGSRSTKRKQ